MAVDADRRLLGEGEPIPDQVLEGVSVTQARDALDDPGKQNVLTEVYS